MSSLSVENSEVVSDNSFNFNLFEKQLDQYIKKLNEADNAAKLKQLIVNDFLETINEFITIGDQTQNALVSPDNNLDVFEGYLINYSFPEDIKNTVILHRNVFLELNKFSIFKSENIVSKSQINAHFSKSKLVLVEQISHFKNKIVLGQKNIRGNKKEQKKVLKKLSLHQNPWDVYKNQLNVLSSQFKLIENNQISLKTTVSAFDSLKNVVASLKGNYENLETQLQDSITNILSHHDSDKKHQELTFFIEEQLVKTATLGNNQLVFTEDLNEKISQLQKIKAPIASNNGLLTIREMDLGKTAHKWFDYQILPDFMDLVAIENSLKNLYSICLNNLKNSLQLDKSTQNNDINYTQIIANLQSDLSELGIKGKQTITRIINNSNEQLKVSNFIQGQPFLEVPFNSSLHFKSDNLLNSIKLPIQKGVNFFNSQFIKSAKYNAFPNVELATECLTYRMYKETNEHYDALFLNKKFIGDLFLILRQPQEDKLNTTINQWNSGFNKSVLVKGERLSGRTTFIEYTSKKYFGKHIVNLKPNSSATIDGRKFATTFNLKEALQYIKNNNIKSTKPIILIDDFELWRDNDNTLLSNTRALINFIETESDNALVMVSTSNAMVEHLDRRLEFSVIFSTVIDVSKTDKTAIKEALLLRHGAAHRKLISLDDEPLSAKQIEKAIDKISHQYRHNLGDVLQAWTYHTFVKNDNSILFDYKDHEFPNFFTQQEIIILKQASIFKTITEFGLKRVTASGFEAKFKSATKRLINTKVLLRDTSGNLYINPVILNEVYVFINQRN